MPAVGLTARPSFGVCRCWCQYKAVGPTACALHARRNRLHRPHAGGAACWVAPCQDCPAVRSVVAAARESTASRPLLVWNRSVGSQSAGELSRLVRRCGGIVYLRNAAPVTSRVSTRICRRRHRPTLLASSASSCQQQKKQQRQLAEKRANPERASRHDWVRGVPWPFCRAPSFSPRGQLVSASLAEPDRPARS